MSGITAMGTTYNLPNYTGLMYGLTPQETPLFSAIGGMSGGRQSTATEFEWGFYDLRSPGQNVQLEGATAPTAQERVRSNGNNVTQIHQEKVSISYSKQAATGQHNGSNVEGTNPVGNELDWQSEQMLIQIARDIEYSFMLGVYNKPTDNTTKRQTRGLLTAIQTNLVGNSTSTITGLSAATDTITETATALANGDKIVFTDVGASTAISTGRTYFVVQKATNTFKVSLTSGGSAITIGTATVSYRKPWTTAATPDTYSAAFQSIYDNGGIRNVGSTVLMVNSTQKIKLSSAYANAYGKYQETQRTIGGVAVDNVTTDFGTFGVMLSRFVPQDAIVVADLSQCSPVWLEVPGKGHMFAEPLAKTGASDEVQLYAEVGLAYGNERAHGMVTGLAI